MKLNQTAIAVILSLAGLAHANPLQEELQNLLGAHPSLRASQRALEASERRVGVAFAAQLPRLTYTGDTGKENINLNNGANLTELDRRKSSMVLEQNIFNGGRRSAAVSQAEIDRTIQGLNLEASRQDIMLEGITAYLQVARYLTLIELTKRNEEITRKQLELETKRVQMGGGIAVDQQQAETRLQVVKERRVFFEQSLRDALATYEQVFGRAPDQRRMQDVGIFSKAMPVTMLDAVQRSMTANPRLSIAALQVQRADRQITVEQSAYVPSIDLVATHNQDVNVNQIRNRDEKSVLVRATWNLFSGLETYNRMQAAVKDHEEQQERQQATSNKTRESVRIAWNQITNGNERLEFIERAVKSAAEVLQNRKQLRDAGKETAVVVLDAEVEYFGILSTKVNAIFDTRIGAYKLLAAMGELTPERIGVNAPSLDVPMRPLDQILKEIVGS